MDVDIQHHYDSVLVMLEVAGRLVTAHAYPSYWFGNYLSNDAVLFTTTGCGGTAYIKEMEGNVQKILPDTVVTGPETGVQTLHISELLAPVPITVRSYRRYNVDGCIPMLPSAYYPVSGARPVAATLDLSTLGPPPFSVVRTP